MEGLIRLGPARDPWSLDAITRDIPIHLIPGAGIKFFRTGAASGDAVFADEPLRAIPNRNYNFFSVPLSNSYKPIQSKENQGDQTSINGRFDHLRKYK